MCGIFGWQLEKKPQVSKRRALASAATALQIQNDTRGGHSWGYYAPGKGLLVKGLGNISRHVCAADLARHRAVLAHTRYATTGEVCPENAHPFEVGSIVGAHNGIVWNHAKLNASHGRNCPVDSMHLFHHLDESAPMEEIEAYGAVEYVKTAEPGTIYLGRFNGGALAVRAVPGLGLIWSSDAAHLKRALRLAGLFKGSKAYSAEDGRLYLATNGELYDSGEYLGVSDKKAGYKSAWDDYRKGGTSTADATDYLPLSRRPGVADFCEHCCRDCDCSDGHPDPSSAEYCGHCKRDCMCIWHYAHWH
jgi:hypothetical protein